MPALYASIPSPAPSAAPSCQSRDPEVTQILDEIRRLEPCLGGPDDNAACFNQIVALLHDLRNRIQERELRRYVLGGPAACAVSSFAEVRPVLQRAG